MSDNVLEKLFEHNHWSNLQIIQACSALSAEQLNAEPRSAMFGSIRDTLLHLIRSQQGYLRLLTLPLEQRQEPVMINFEEVLPSATYSGEKLIALARDWNRQPVTERVQTRDGYLVEPWVIMVQIINHATEHREQIKSMLSAMGITPPEIDGWTYGDTSGAMAKVRTE